MKQVLQQRPLYHRSLTSTHCPSTDISDKCVKARLRLAFGDFDPDFFSTSSRQLAVYLILGGFSYRDPDTIMNRPQMRWLSSIVRTRILTPRLQSRKEIFFDTILRLRYRCLPSSLYYSPKTSIKVLFTTKTLTVHVDNIAITMN